MFDELDSTCPPKPNKLQDELTRYLSTDIKFTADAIQWWHNKCSDFSCLSKMAIDYLMNPGKSISSLYRCKFLTVNIATAVDVECAFSCGRLLITHIRNPLSSQTLCTLMCLGDWSKLGFVEDSDIHAVVILPEVPEEDGNEDGDILMPDGWDAITSK